jgi:hypothetical protein
MTRDLHREAAREWLAELIAEAPPQIGQSPEDRAYREIGQVAAAQVELATELRMTMAAIAKALDVELSPRQDGKALAWVRRRAATPSGQESVDAILQSIHDTHTDALRVAKQEPAGRDDGSLPSTGMPYLDDEDALRDRNEFITGHRFSQLERHRQLALAGKAGDAGAGDFMRDIWEREQAKKGKKK